MSFVLPDLVIESVIRDGIENIKQNPAILDDLFGQLILPHNARKYGATEIEKIKTLLDNKNIAVVHSFHLGASKSPAYSIQLGNDAEAKREARLDDFEEDILEDITDAQELQDLIKAEGFTPDMYDPLTGIISLPDAVDLSEVYKGNIFVDASDVEHTITGGVNNLDGQKSIFVAKGSDVNISAACSIKSQIDFKQYEVKGVTHDVSILIGVHTKDALTTKYLYLVLKYILMSRKKYLIKRGFFLASLQGSDFTRDMEYQGDTVYNRFLTITGKVEDTWKANQVIPIEHFVIDADPVDC